MDIVVEVKNLAKSFQGRSVHKDVSFRLHRSECFGLIGGSGVGKSVILRSLIGLEKIDQGEIIVNKENIVHYSENQLIPLRKKVAYVFQGGALFDSMRVYDNLAYPLREHTRLSASQIADRIETQLNEFGLGGTEHLFPAQLSGGMQKRVGLARAIILDPEIILYDEPTAGLDPFNTKKIQEMILRLKSRGVSSILVTHDMSTAFAVCDRVAMLHGGKIQERGEAGDLEHDENSLIQKFIRGEKIEERNGS